LTTIIYRNSDWAEIEYRFQVFEQEYNDRFEKAAGILSSASAPGDLQLFGMPGYEDWFALRFPRRLLLCVLDGSKLHANAGCLRF
jgi:hypothetical protein